MTCCLFCSAMEWLIEDGGLIFIILLLVVFALGGLTGSETHDCPPACPEISTHVW